MSDFDNRPRGNHFKSAASQSEQTLQTQNAPQVPNAFNAEGSFSGLDAEESFSTAYADERAQKQSPYQEPQQSPYRPQMGQSQLPPLPTRHSSHSGNSSSEPSGARYTPSGNYPGRKRSKAPKIILGVVAVLLIALVGVGAATLYSAKNLKAQAREVIQDVATVTDAAKSQDFAAAAKAARNIELISTQMNKTLSSPLFTVASWMPVVGQDIASARTLTNSLNEVATQGLVPMTQTLEANPPSVLISGDKTINVDAATQIFNAVAEAAPSMQACATTVADLPPFHLEQLENLMGPAREKLTTANDLFQKAAAFAPIARDVLGANSNRVYLITAQNTAEIRASGGFPGSLGALTIQNGHIELNEFSTVYDVMEVNTPESMGVTDAERALFGGFMDVARDAGMDPDFPRVAAIWAAAYEAKTGTRVDGVISVTPAVVQDLLAVAGSVTLADGTEVDGTNATKVLQHDLYWKYLSKDTAAAGNGELTDALFAQTADLAFNKFFSNINSKSLIDFANLMAQGMGNRSVMVWLSNSSEQEQLDQLHCSGSVLTDPLKPAVGTYFSLWIGSKMGWYIDIDNQILSESANADGTCTYRVQTTFRNTATPEVLSMAGNYIAGYLDGFDQDNLYPEVFIYAPTGGSISSFEASNGAQFVEGEHEGLQLFHASRPNLRAGESIVCTYEVTCAAGADRLSFMATPTLTKYRE